MKNFRDLSYEDLSLWVGQKTVSRGLSYHKNKQVCKVYWISENIICGSVQGNKMYDTVVSASDHLASTCSCPVGSDCKHGVALILAYLEEIKQGIAAKEPPLEEYVRRYQPLLVSEPKQYDPDIASVGQKIPTKEEYLQTLSKEELIKIILSSIEGSHDIATYLDRRQNLDQASPDSSIAAIIAEIDDVTAQDYDYSDWYKMDEEDEPDYSGILESFTVLLEGKRYADLITLGLILLQKAKEQVEMDNESGSISSQITQCMAVVAEALKLSDHPLHQNLVSAIEFIQNDEYALTDDILGFLNRVHPPSEWSAVADILLKERRSNATENHYRSDQNPSSYADWIEIALERAGRVDEAIEFSKHLAEEENRNLPFIKLLTRTNHKREAIEWIVKVVPEISRNPNAVSPLLRAMKVVFEESEDWLMVSALDTEAFLRNPEIRGYHQMMASARKAGIADAIRPHIHAYLEEGTIPSSANSGSVIPGLLPETGLSYGARFAPVNPPVRPLLLEMALESKDPDEVVTWYIPNTHRIFNGSGAYPDDRVADVIAEKYPDKSVEIWKDLAETIIDMKRPDFYQYAVMYLMKARDRSVTTGKSAEFYKYILHLKTEHARKRRFIQELAVLDTRKILDNSKL